MKHLGEKGVSLLEVLVALVILGIMMGVLMTMMIQERELIRDSKELLQAHLKANEVMETFKVRSYEALQSSSTSFVLESDNKTTVDVSISDFNQTNTLKQIVITVTWLDCKQRERHYTLTTLRSSVSMASTSKRNHTVLQTDLQGERS